jgi:general secretion pathway protein H
MLTSETGTPNSSCCGLPAMISPFRRFTSAALPGRIHSAGFSLLEIMIVVVIIGILVSIFSLSVGSLSDDGTSEHARRLEALIKLAVEEASMEGREIGLLFYQQGYEFSARVPSVDEDGLQVWVWTPLDDDALLKPRDLGEEFSIDVLIENKEIDLDYERKEDDDEENEYRPQIYLFSSGDIAPPFSARFRPSFSDHSVMLSVAADGAIEIALDDF